MAMVVKITKIHFKEKVGVEPIFEDNYGATC